MRSKTPKEIESILILSGIKVTKPRLLIAMQLFSSRDHMHFTIDGLNTELRNKDIVISKATVYNVVKGFSEAGLIKRIVHTGNGSAIYDTDPRPHVHFYNIDREEISNAPPVEELPILSVRSPSGTHIVDMSLVIHIQENNPE